MNKPSFTAAPWHIEESKYQDGNGYFYIMAGKEVLGGDVLVFQGKKTNLANAALIAAAPEMYELLERILGRLEFCKLEQSIDCETEREIRAILAKARAKEAK